ncbi:hypothetical protein B0A49_06096, partial [Cryomyces minteri]
MPLQQLPLPLLLTLPLDITRLLRLLRPPLHLRQTAQLLDKAPLVDGALDKLPAVALVRFNDLVRACAAAVVIAAADEQVVEGGQVAADLVGHKAERVVGAR